MTTINDYAFAYCDQLANFEITENSQLQSITSHVFIFCKLKSFYIPEHLKLLIGNTFEGISTLETITRHQNNKNLEVEDNIVYNPTKTTIYYVASAKTGDFEVQEGITDVFSTSFDTSSLTKVVFPKSLKIIRDWVFYLAKVEEILFNTPTDLREIQEAAFVSSKLKYIVIPENVTTIGREVFGSCTDLKSVVFPKTLKSLGGGAFVSCSPDIEINFTEGSDLAFDKTFYWITNIAKTFIVQCFGQNATYAIPSSAQTIGVNSFSSLTTLKEIKFESDSSLTVIEDSAFSKCTSLKSFEFPANLASIGQNAFSGCTSISNIDLYPLNQLTSVGAYAFSGCTLLESVTFPEKLLSNQITIYLITIGKNAFYNCNQLLNLNLGDSIQSIGDSCFENCQKLQQVTISKDCSSIGNYAFRNCLNLYTCEIDSESQLQTISSYTFYGSGLKSFTFPQFVVTISSFSFCKTSLTDIILPRSVVTIEQHAFENCISLKTFTIPNNSNLQTFQFGVFSGCNSFKEIKNECENFVIWNNALFNANKTTLIVLPAAAEIKYFAFPETVQTIGTSSLEGCRYLEVVFIPYSVESINPYAFRYCKNLKTINLPKTISTIGTNAFEGCTNLQCGLSFEDQTNEFRQKLLKALVPESALKDCIRYCTASGCGRFSFLRYTCIYLATLS